VTEAPAIEAVELRKAYGSFEAVRGIGFAVQRGECFGFLGPNGAGKTTTMRMIHRATPPSGGRLVVLGHEVGDGRNDRAIKERVGVVPQEPSLDENLTPHEILAVFARFYGLRGARGRARADELLALVGLADRASSAVRTLSGGLKRRLQIARGLLGKPEILVLDEPTTGLDPQARNRLWEQLVELRRAGTTLLLTTHYMDEAEKLCDRLVVMHQGRIVAEGSPGELIARHVAPQVLEIAVEDAAAAAHFAQRWGSAARKTARLAQRLLFYVEDGEALVRQVVHEAPGAGATLRRANLEDVFLEITGHGLLE
jgi:lipooligosaccharide transport system ATP-binding protein